MPDLTFITPIAPHHTEYFHECSVSVQNQTIPCAHLHMVDVDRRGAGWVRNRLLERVTTPFVTFLDADDTIDPTFAEIMLAAYQPGRYVTSDWYMQDKHWYADSFGFGDGWHLVNAVMLTEDARRIGGFDESLPALEDRDFYLKLMNHGVCPIRVPQPLVTYSNYGQRSKLSAQQAHRLKNLVDMRWTMGCCGDDDNKPAQTLKQEGDILAYFVSQGSTREQGKVTKRLYRKPGAKKPIWVNRDDALAMPRVFKIVEPLEGKLPEQDSTPRRREVPLQANGFLGLQGVLKNTDVFRERAPELTPVEIPDVLPQPDLERLISLGQGALGVSNPVFVVPDKDYPSYTDFRRLVKLSGYDMLKWSNVNWSQPGTVIIATPDDLPDTLNTSKRVIWWDLEWEYWSKPRPNLPYIDEVWASDPAYAERSGAKFVLLGSHAGLNPDYQQVRKYEYDVTMLGYMVGRREQVKRELEALGQRLPEDYPGHGTDRRHEVLTNTRTMLHVHQHADRPAIAPLRIALAAAYKMPVLSELTLTPGDYTDHITFTPYDELAERSTKRLTKSGGKLYTWLCEERTFRKEVDHALNA